MTDHTPDRAALRDRIADAIRDAACQGDCGKPEEQCAQQRIQPFAWHHGRLAVVEGSPEMFADVALAAVFREAAELAQREGDRLYQDRWPTAAQGAWTVAEKLRRMAVEEQPATEPQPASPRCTNCTHPKRDHDGRADHRARYSPLVAGDPWCHACNATCDYVAEQPAAADTDEEQHRG